MVNVKSTLASLAAIFAAALGSFILGAAYQTATAPGGDDTATQKSAVFIYFMPGEGPPFGAKIYIDGKDVVLIKERSHI